MSNHPEILSRRPQINRHSLLASLMPELPAVTAAPIEEPNISSLPRRRALLLTGGAIAVLLVGTRSDIVYAGRNRGNSRNRTGSGDTEAEKAKRQAKKGNEGRKKGQNSQESASNRPERCAQGIVNIYNPTTGEKDTLNDSCAPTPAGWQRGTPGRSR